MKNIIYAVLTDIVSIQEYVFGSNKLKQNLGASFLVQEVYRSYLKEAFKNIFKQDFDIDSWRSKPNENLIETKPFEVGYIGGGNALLFFQEEAKAKEFLKEWTKILLIKTPGIKTAVALKAFDLGDFNKEKNEIFKILQDNKSKYIPQTIIPRHGFTAECVYTGFSCDIWNDINKKKGYISSVANAKIEAFRESKEKTSEEFKGILEDKFCFTDDLEILGQSKDENNHIAIVHIDGNGMGKRFKASNSLESIRKLSASVEKATKTAFGKLLEKLTEKIDEIVKEFIIAKEGNKQVLPIRPIIMGGDDITFVCDGRLGIYFAKIFMEEFEKQTVSDNAKLTSCAGISITKTKYPFYRGYELSEQLCKNAKEYIKDKKMSGSWLDFHISYGGFTGTLEEIRERHYKVCEYSLLYRPYCINLNDKKSLESLIANTIVLNKIPNSKIKELRQILTLGEESRKTFVTQLKERSYNLPKINGYHYEETLFQGGETPYFDMIELLEFYPEFELDRKDN